MSVILVKSNVLFTRIAPGGFRILSAIDQVAAQLGVDLVITSACDGEHSGPEDPHPEGKAYDVRSHDLGDLKEKVIASIMAILGYERFYGFIEAEGTDNEHFHIQVKKGTTYP
jgi:hypothetical protein